MHSLFEGMDTEEGIVPGLAAWGSISGALFPMSKALQHVIPVPFGWGALEATVLTVFFCLAAKTFLHTYRRGISFSQHDAKGVGLLWVLFAICHYGSLGMSQYASELINGDRELILLIPYSALFLLPTYGFSAMQIEAARGDKGS